MGRVHTQRAEQLEHLNLHQGIVSVQHWREGGREGEREGRRKGGREEGGRAGGREGGRKGRREEGGRAGGREGGRESTMFIHWINTSNSMQRPPTAMPTICYAPELNKHELVGVGGSATS